MSARRTLPVLVAALAPHAAAHPPIGLLEDDGRVLFTDGQAVFEFDEGALATIAHGSGIHDIGLLDGDLVYAATD
ncbi:MAG: hypothetical protein KDA28_14070, partial [Phycisphaerales bacterium]|nr:hypothetical protein [Phycisphaerales bacterium]